MAPMHVLAVIAWLVTMTLAGSEAYHQSMKLKTRSSDGAALCAMDPPTLTAGMYDRMPGAPAAVRCGMTCTNGVQCKHFNYVSTESNPCQLYHYRPTQFDVSPNCHHFYQPDVDECAVNNGGCSQFATCTNLPDSFSCTCNSGYTGDGFDCQEITTTPLTTTPTTTTTPVTYAETTTTLLTTTPTTTTPVTFAEVRLMDGTASKGRLEANVFGQYRPVCTNGFDNADATVACKVLGFEYGLYITDQFGASTASQCLDNVQCTGAETSFLACSSSVSSYNPTNTDHASVSCDIDECATNNGNCSAHADCTNTMGSFTCTCQSGYTGDGFTCTVSCPVSDGFTYDSSRNTCFKLVTQANDWSSANTACHGLNSRAHLVVIGNQQKQTALKKFLQDQASSSSNCPENQYFGKSFWTAGQEKFGASTRSLVWKVSFSNGTVTQQPLVFTNWYSNNPNFYHGSAHQCLAVLTERSYEWNDDTCSVDYCFVCEIVP